MYDALVDAGVSTEKARAAAVSISEESVATKGDIDRVEKKLTSDIKRLEKEMAVMKWMLGVVMVATVFPLIKDLF